MFSFVSVNATQNNVDQLNALNDGYEYEMVELGNAKQLLGEQDIAAMTTAYEEVAGDYVANKLAAVAGAVAVSVYHHAGFDVAFDSVARLAAASKQQKLIVRRKKFHNL